MLVLPVTLAIACKGPGRDLPERCSDMGISDRALGAWMYSFGQRDREGLNRATNCMVEGCKTGESESCSNLALLCHDSEHKDDEALRKVGACSMPGVAGATNMRGDPVVPGKR